MSFEDSKCTVNELVMRLENTKRLDMKTSVQIAGIANCLTRDANGNLLPFVWTRQSVCNEFENATLLTRDSLQKHLESFIEAGVKDNLDIIRQCEDPAVFVDWVVRISEFWERRYAEKRNEKYDISQNVYAVMFELLNTNQIWPMLKTKGLQKVILTVEDNIHRVQENKFYQQMKKYVNLDSEKEQDLASKFWLHQGTNAIVRLLFRSESISELRDRLCVLSGKLLQKKEVCNKAGGYASQRQRADVVQEYCYAVENFHMWLNGLSSSFFEPLLKELTEQEWIFLIVDHTALPIPMTQIVTPSFRSTLGNSSISSAAHGVKRSRSTTEEITEEQMPWIPQWTTNFENN